MPNLKIIDDSCIACGQCYAAEPDYFEVDEQNDFKAKIKKQPEDEAKAKGLIETCPSEAIVLE